MTIVCEGTLRATRPRAACLLLLWSVCMLHVVPACSEDTAGSEQTDPDYASDIDGSTDADSDGEQPVTIIVDSRFAPGPDTLGDGVQEFLDMLGAVGFGDPVLATSSAGASILREVEAGTVDMGIDVLSLQATGDPELDAVLDLYGDSLPFGLQGAEYLAYLETQGVALLESILADHGFENVRILPVIANTGQAAAMARGPLDEATLSNGVVMRAFGFGQQIMSEAYPSMTFVPAEGGSPAAVVEGFNEQSLYAAEFVNPCIDDGAILGSVDQGVVTHYYIDNWQTPATVFFLMYRADLIESAGLSLERLRTAQRASLMASMLRLMTRQSDCLATIRDRGIAIESLPTEVLAALRAATFAVLEDAAESNADVAAVLDSTRLFVKRHRRWLNGGPVDRDARWDWPGYESDL